MMNNHAFQVPARHENSQQKELRPDLDMLRAEKSYLPNALNKDLLQSYKNTILPDLANAKQLLESVEIDPEEELEEAPACLKILQGETSSIFGTLGNISLIIGKAKSRKTFFVTSLLASAIKNGKVIQQINGSLPENQRMCLFFDSEQSKYHAQKAVRRAIKLSGESLSVNIKAYGLRKFDPSLRLKLIETAIYDTPDLGLVVIDGVRDLISSINDEEQSTMLSSKLLKWSEERNIHIVCVLHQNKGDNNARGHLGSELMNKAESVLSVTKSTDNSEVSIVTPEYCREKDFEPFAFGIDNEGLPYLEENWCIKPEGGSRKKTYSPLDITIDKHKEIIKLAFKKNPKQRLSDLLIQLKLALETFGFKMGDNKVKDFRAWYENEGLIQQQGAPQTKASYYTLNELS